MGLFDDHHALHHGMQATDVFHLALSAGDELEALVLAEIAGLDLGGGHRMRQEVLVGPHDRVAGCDLYALGNELHAFDPDGMGRAGYFFPSDDAIILAWSRWAAMAGRTFSSSAF